MGTTTSRHPTKPANNTIGNSYQQVEWAKCAVLMISVAGGTTRGEQPTIIQTIHTHTNSPGGTVLVRMHRGKLACVIAPCWCVPPLHLPLQYVSDCTVSLPQHNYRPVYECNCTPTLTLSVPGRRAGFIVIKVLFVAMARENTAYVAGSEEFCLTKNCTRRHWSEGPRVGLLTVDTFSLWSLDMFFSTGCLKRLSRSPSSFTDTCLKYFAK